MQKIQSSEKAPEDHMVHTCGTMFIRLLLFGARSLQGTKTIKAMEAQYAAAAAAAAEMMASLNPAVPQMVNDLTFLLKDELDHRGF